MDSVWEKFNEFYIRLTKECKTRIEHEILRENRDFLYGKFLVKMRIEIAGAQAADQLKAMTVSKNSSSGSSE